MKRTKRNIKEKRRIKNQNTLKKSLVRIYDLIQREETYLKVGINRFQKMKIDEKSIFEVKVGNDLYSGDFRNILSQVKCLLEDSSAEFESFWSKFGDFM